MKSLIAVLSIIFATQASAHCPIEVQKAGEDYCLSLEWATAEVKKATGFEELSDLSPMLNKMGTVPPQWQYSKAIVKVWKHGDESHSPVQWNDFRVFPFMTMADGHHHSASYVFQWDTAKSAYVLSQMAFSEMEGCWSLRWTFAAKDEMATSSQLMNIEAYTNLTPEENIAAAGMCSLCTSTPTVDDGGHTGHDHTHP